MKDLEKDFLDDSFEILVYMIFEITYFYMNYLSIEILDRETQKIK
tara:strand:+ start:504 stop:638 length:135 start_codon:yes stop_codon:yes gene_type:complete